MIRLCPGASVQGLIDKVRRGPNRFRSVIVASPFIDDFGVSLLCVIDTLPVGLSFLVLTRPETVSDLSGFRWRRAQFAAFPNLHAKVYVALGIRAAYHEAVLTSANLTKAGLHYNVELGVHVTGSNARFARLVEQIVTWTRITSVAPGMAKALANRRELTF